jgi:hypothetical protein
MDTALILSQSDNPGRMLMTLFVADAQAFELPADAAGGSDRVDQRHQPRRPQRQQRLDPGPRRVRRQIIIPDTTSVHQSLEPLLPKRSW